MQAFLTNFFIRGTLEISVHPSYIDDALLWWLFPYVSMTSDGVFHDEVEIEDFEYDEDDETYYYPCPCGDRFQITKVS